MLPASFAKFGLKTALQVTTTKRKRVMIGTEGESESGKTEFILSAPGPGIIVCLDRGHEAMLENAKPPDTRRDDFGFDIINPVKEGQTDKNGYLDAWRDVKDNHIYRHIANPDCLTLGIDTDSDLWQLQLLADFGKSTQIPQIMRTQTNINRKAFTTRLFDCGKNIIGTNMLRDDYRTITDDNGKAVLKDGKEQTYRTGARKRQGFPDQDYLWQIQIRHFKTEARYLERLKKTIPSKFGIEILKCKVNGELVGTQFTGSECNFKSLVLAAYPNSTATDWGYK